MNELPPDLLAAVVALCSGTAPPGVLEARVRAYARDLKHAAVPVSRGVAALIAAATDPGLIHSGGPVPREMVDRIVRWCIEEYGAAS